MGTDLPQMGVPFDILAWRPGHLSLRCESGNHPGRDAPSHQLSRRLPATPASEAGVVVSLASGRIEITTNQTRSKEKWIPAAHRILRQLRESKNRRSVLVYYTPTPRENANRATGACGEHGLSQQLTQLPCNGAQHMARSLIRPARHCRRGCFRQIHAPRRYPPERSTLLYSGASGHRSGFD